MTIKFFGLIPRLPQIDSDEFHDHYRHPHGTLGLGLPTIKRYVQSHQIYTPLLDDKQSYFEAVAEDWFDTVEDATGLSTDSHYVKHIQPDEPLFVDLPRLKWLNTRENVIADQGAEDLAEADKRWNATSAPRFVKILQFLCEDDTRDLSDTDDIATAFALGALRYVRCDPAAEIYQTEEPAYRVVRELYWPTLHDFKVGQRASATAWDRLTAVSDNSVTLLAVAERFL